MEDAAADQVIAQQLDDYGYKDETVDPGTLGGTPSSMPSNAWWLAAQKVVDAGSEALSARIKQSAGINPAPTNQAGLNRQASTTPGAVRKLGTVLSSPNVQAMIVFAVVLAVGIVVVRKLTR